MRAATKDGKTNREWTQINADKGNLTERHKDTKAQRRSEK